MLSSVYFIIFSKIRKKSADKKVPCSVSLYFQ